MGKKFLWIVGLFALLMAETMEVDLNSTPAGAIPEGWMMASYNKNGVGIWEVTPQKHLLILHPRGYTKNQFNLFYTNAFWSGKGSIETRFKPQSGTKIEGGGVVWHMRDRKHFLAAMVDTKSKKLHIFATDGKDIKSVESIPVPITPQWHTLKVRFDPNRATIYLDNKLITTIQTPNPTIGGVGLITAGDAKTLFEGIKVRRDTR